MAPPCPLSTCPARPPRSHVRSGRDNSQSTAPATLFDNHPTTPSFAETTNHSPPSHDSSLQCGLASSTCHLSNPPTPTQPSPHPSLPWLCRRVASQTADVMATPHDRHRSCCRSHAIPGRTPHRPQLWDRRAAQGPRSPPSRAPSRAPRVPDASLRATQATTTTQQAQQQKQQTQQTEQKKQEHQLPFRLPLHHCVAERRHRLTTVVSPFSPSCLCCSQTSNDDYARCLWCLVMKRRDCFHSDSTESDAAVVHVGYG